MQRSRVYMQKSKSQSAQWLENLRTTINLTKAIRKGGTLRSMVAMSNAGKAFKPFGALSEMCKGLQANGSVD